MSIKKSYLQVRFRPIIKNQLEEAAQAAQMSQSEYAAKAVEEKIERERKEVQQ